MLVNLFDLSVFFLYFRALALKTEIQDKELKLVAVIANAGILMMETSKPNDLDLNKSLKVVDVNVNGVFSHIAFYQFET